MIHKRVANPEAASVQNADAASSFYEEQLSEAYKKELDRRTVLIWASFGAGLVWAYVVGELLMLLVLEVLA